MIHDCSSFGSRAIQKQNSSGLKKITLYKPASLPLINFENWHFYGVALVKCVQCSNVLIIYIKFPLYVLSTLIFLIVNLTIALSLYIFIVSIIHHLPLNNCKIGHYTRALLYFPLVSHIKMASQKNLLKAFDVLAISQQLIF